MIERIAAMSSRAKVFVVVAILLAIFAATGFLTASSDIDISREEAVEIAREQVDWEPVDADARLLRQGFGLNPVWAVALSIPNPDNPRDFVRLTTVEVDAKTGEVTRIAVVRGETDGS